MDLSNQFQNKKMSGSFGKQSKKPILHFILTIEDTLLGSSVRRYYMLEFGLKTGIRNVNDSSFTARAAVQIIYKSTHCRTCFMREFEI